MNKKPHSILSPSNAHRWMKCPGSLHAENANFEKIKTENVFSEEGNIAHALAYHKLSNIPLYTNVKNKFLKLSKIEKLDMEQNVYSYMEYCNNIGGDNSLRYYEYKVSLKHILPGRSGIIDCLIIDGETLHIIDFKYGQGIKILAQDNYQLLLYAIGALNLIQFVTQINNINLVVFQPRLDHIDEMAISIFQLNDYYLKIKQKALLAKSKNAPRIPGLEQCRFCNAAPRCKALRNYTNEKIMNFVNDDVKNLTDEELKSVLDNKDLINMFTKKVTEYVTRKLLRGDHFPGYKMVNKRSTRKWEDEEEAERLLNELKLPDGCYTKKLLSVAQAEKVIFPPKKYLTPELSNIVTFEQGMKLAKDSEKEELSIISFDPCDLLKYTET